MKENATEKCPICSSQEEKITDQILKILISKNYAKNSIIFDQEQPCSGLYLIKSGAVKVSKLSPDGKEMLIEILHAGNTLGEAGLLGQEKHSDTATATEASEVFFLPKQEFQIILMKHPELYQSVVQSLIRWMDKLHLVIENISLSSARGRVLGYISRLEKEQNNSTIRLSAKKHEVALMLGLRPETFSRTLTELESEGLIKLDHKQIHILQRA